MHLYEILLIGFKYSTCVWGEWNCRLAMSGVGDFLIQIIGCRRSRFKWR